jgi:hypothetical protein
MLTNISIRDHCAKAHVGLGWAGLEVFDVSVSEKQGMQALFGRKQTTDRED